MRPLQRVVRRVDWRFFLFDGYLMGNCQKTELAVIIVEMPKKKQKKPESAGRIPRPVYPFTNTVIFARD